MPDNKEETVKAPLFDEFVGSLREIGDIIAETVVALAREGGDAEEVQHAKAFAGPLAETMSQTAELLKSTGARANAEEKASAEVMLRTMGSSSLVTQAKSLGGAIKGFIGKFGVSQIVQLVKKLIKWLLDIFKIKVPWINKLVDLIDEILNALLSGGNAKFAHALSVREQDYMGELAALANLEASEARLNDIGDMDDDY